MAALRCIITGAPYAAGDAIGKDSSGERFCVSKALQMTPELQEQIAAHMNSRKAAEGVTVKTKPKATEVKAMTDDGTADDK